MQQNGRGTKKCLLQFKSDFSPYPWGKWETEESVEPLERLKISGDAQSKTFPQMNKFPFDQTKKDTKMCLS